MSSPNATRVTEVSSSISKHATDRFAIVGDFLARDVLVFERKLMPMAVQLYIKTCLSELAHLGWGHERQYAAISNGLVINTQVLAKFPRNTHALGLRARTLAVVNQRPHHLVAPRGVTKVQRAIGKPGEIAAMELVLSRLPKHVLNHKAEDRCTFQHIVSREVKGRRKAALLQNLSGDTSDTVEAIVDGDGDRAVRQGTGIQSL